MARSQREREVSIFIPRGNLTNRHYFSINTIDKNRKLCYTKDKLENKTNILTTNNKTIKQTQRKKMTQTIDLPTKVIDSDWKDDIDYEPYEEKKHIYLQKT